jgi:hypothetical protein
LLKKSQTQYQAFKLQSRQQSCNQGSRAAIKAAEQHHDSPFDFEGLASLILEDHRLEPSFSSRLSFHCLLSELTFLFNSF